MTIAEKIKELRYEHDLTQGQLACKLGVYQQCVSEWETGRNEPSMFNCILLADVFKITLDELCCRGDYNV